ncbi:lipid-A-disaccharide synthase-related protein [Gloeobacter violaceus]|uniref:Gll2539 protein n=1 Tax=Gloeobacter violaceus (strain ATCC 29082 / PCC 7421) TaxID=251221 RepID=Q7NHJ6_GLOVI|nr:lipid-A-disaccharide synthase-related protein [Gloeobacter violaceus]BAC90480.1 gll2539 [Gloeobacter violaceus PCC 7421]
MHRILFISDGHGEDWVAAQIASHLTRLSAQRDLGALELRALPMVGDGHSYERIGVPLALTTRVLPSGGFTFKTMRGLWLDLRSGLAGYGAHLVRSVRGLADWADLVVAVGDILPLSLAWLTGKPYIFVGCTKSDYYTEGAYSCYFPWERALLHPPRCLHAFTRDRITCRNLRLHRVPASYWGNPMMDGLEWNETHQPPRPEGTFIGLLPGSRPGEAQRNLLDMLRCLEAVRHRLGEPVHFEAAISAGLGLESFRRQAAPLGWQEYGEGRFERNATAVVLRTDNFSAVLHRAHLLIAMAGTATEQAVGLGKPVITLPGRGPQFTRRFAYLQRQLLGDSVRIVDVAPARRPEAVASTAADLIKDRERLGQFACNGRERMGGAGAASQIAEFTLDQLPRRVRGGTPQSRG